MCIITYLQLFYTAFSYTTRNENKRQCLVPNIDRFNNTLNFDNSGNPQYSRPMVGDKLVINENTNMR
jgi:hypothetical protein